MFILLIIIANILRLVGNECDILQAALLCHMPTSRLESSQHFARHFGDPIVRPLLRRLFVIVSIIIDENSTHHTTQRIHAVTHPQHISHTAKESHSTSSHLATQPRIAHHNAHHHTSSSRISHGSAIQVDEQACLIFENGRIAHVAISI